MKSRKETFKCLDFGYLGGVISPSVLIMPKMNRYVKAFDVNKLMSFCIDYDAIRKV